jgi:hypothetical protein
MTTALAMPEPERNTPAIITSDFDGMIRISKMLAMSSLVPGAYRGKPENVLLATLAGQPFGWDPTMAMRSFHVIEGQPSLKPEIQLALVRRAGHSVTGETSPTGATITGKRRDTGDTMTVTYTIEDARRANLLGKSVWKSFPASMCWARALSQLCRMLFPDVVLGCGYTPEELGAEVSHDDVSTPQVQPVQVLPIVTRAAAPVDVVDAEVVEPEYIDVDPFAAEDWNTTQPATDTVPLTGDSISEAQTKNLMRLKTKLGLDGDAWKALLGDTFGVESGKALTKRQASQLIDTLMERAGEPQKVRS